MWVQFFFKYLFIYLRLCWVFTATCRLSPVSGSVGHSVVEEHRLLTAVASPCGGEQALGCSGFGRWGTRAQLPHSIWDPPGPGIEPVSPALQGKLSTTGPPGKPPGSVLELERSPGERNGNLLQCSWLGYPIDRGAWWAAVHAVAYVCVCIQSLSRVRLMLSDSKTPLSDAPLVSKEPSPGLKGVGCMRGTFLGHGLRSWDHSLDIQEVAGLVSD